MKQSTTLFTVSNVKNYYYSNSIGCLKDFQNINLPFLVIASLHGIYCFNDTGGIRGKVLYVLNRAFQVVLIGTVWYAAYNSLQHAFSSWDILRNANLQSVVNDVWMFGLGLAIGSFYIACHGFPWSKTSPAMLQLRQLWTGLKLPKHEINNCEKYLQKMHHVVTATTLLYLIFNMAVNVHPITALAIPSTFMEIMAFLEISCWTLCVSFLLLLCISFCRIFSIANAIISPMETKIQTNALEKFSNLHQQATDLCQIFSNSFGFYLLYALIELLFELIIYLDLMIIGNLHVNEKVEIGLFAVISSSYILVIWYAAAAVHTEAYRAYEVINRIGSTAVTELDPFQRKMLTFQQCRLGNDTIGIEIPGIGVITNRTFVTIFSVFCTYLFLLVQFQIDARNENVSCYNSTST